MSDNWLVGSVLEDMDMTLEEMAGMCPCNIDLIVKLVDEGIIDPQGSDLTDWRFNGPCLIRTRMAMRLQQDLNINLAGIAMVIDLIDEINELQSRLRLLETR